MAHRLEGDDAEFTATDIGMTLRDWFAGQALPPVVSWSLNEPQQPGDTADICAARYAAFAYALADAMLEQRAKS